MQQPAGADAAARRAATSRECFPPRLDLVIPPESSRVGICSFHRACARACDTPAATAQPAVTRRFHRFDHHTHALGYSLCSGGYPV
jgi:hypothetical protein